MMVHPINGLCCHFTVEAGSTCFSGSYSSAQYALAPASNRGLVTRPPIQPHLAAHVSHGLKHPLLQPVSAVPAFQSSTLHPPIVGSSDSGGSSSSSSSASSSLGTSQGQVRRGGRWLRPKTGPPAPPPTAPPSPQGDLPFNTQQSSKQSSHARVAGQPSSAGDGSHGKSQLVQGGGDGAGHNGEPRETRVRHGTQSPLQHQHQYQQLEEHEQQQPQLAPSHLELRLPPANPENRELQEPYYENGHPPRNAAPASADGPQLHARPGEQKVQVLERGGAPQLQGQDAPPGGCTTSDSHWRELRAGEALTPSMAAPNNGSSSLKNNGSSTRSSRSGQSNGSKQRQPSAPEDGNSPKRNSKSSTGQRRPLHFTSWRNLLTWLDAPAAAQTPSLALSTAHAFMQQQQQQQQQERKVLRLSTPALDASGMPADSASNMHVSSDIFSSIGMRGGVTASNQDSNSGCSTPEPHRIDSDPTSSSTNSRSMSGSGETEVTHTTNSTRDARVGGQERSKQDPGLLVLVLNALAKLAIARAAEAGPRGGAAVEWKQLLESVFYLLAELEPCLIETQQQSQQQQQQQQQPFRNEAISAVSREGSTSSSMTAPHLARLVRSLNMLLLLHPPPTATPTSTAHSKDPQPLGHHSQTSPPQQQPQQQHQKQRRQQQHRSLPFSLPSHWVAHLRAALTAVLQHVQPEELVLLLRALSLDGACVALSLKGAPTSSVGLEEEVTSGGSTERRTSSPSPNASRDSSTPPPMPSPPSSSPTVLSPPLPHSSSPPPPLLSLPAPLLATPPSSSSSPPAVAATAMAAVLRVLPLLSPRQCSICLSCVTLLEWQPARPWVLAVMSRLEQAELQAIKLQGDQGSTPLQQRGQLQHQQHQGQPSLSGKQQRQPSESLSAVHFSPMSVRDAEQVLVSLAHLHVHPPPRLADMLLRALAAAFVPTPLPSSADGPQSPATSPPGLQSPQPPQAPPSPYMPEATAAAAAALKAQGHPTSPPATALQHPLPPPAPPPPFSSTTRTPRNAASQSHSLPSFPFRPPQLSLQQAGTASDHNQEGTTADPPANPQLPSAPLSPSLTPTQLSSSLWAIASLGLHPPAPWLAAFMQITFNTIQGFSARTLAEVLWAIASLRWEPSQLWMDRALAAMSSKVEELRAGEVAITVWALSRLRFRARSDLLAALFAHVTSPRLLPLLDGRGISMLMTACARTNYMPPATSMRPLASRILSLLQNTASASRTPPQQRHASPEAPEADSGQQQHQQHQQQRKHTRSARRQTHHTRQQHGHGMHEPQGSSLSLAPQGIANLAWAIEVRALYTEYPELVPALHAASLAVMPSFSPVELGMLGVAIGSIVQAQLHARNQAKAKAEAGGGRSSASGGRGRRRPQQAGSFPPVILPSSEWVAAYAAASRHVLLQQHRAQQLSAAQLAGRDKGRTSTSNNRRDANSAIGIGRGSTGSSTSAGGGLNGGGGSSARVASSMLMGFARMSPDGKLPPSDWLDTWFEVTAGTLLTFNPREMEQVCEGLRLLRPPPAPPLPWVRAFSDRRDVLSDHAGTNAHLRKQLLLVLRMLRNAWQDKVSQASAQSP